MLRSFYNYLDHVKCDVNFLSSSTNIIFLIGSSTYIILSKISISPLEFFN